MATPATVNPFNFYPGRDGLPLQSGYLYFGEPFQDPELQPLQAYWDDANTQPAARPIRTINGYPARNGSPAQVFVAAQYSMRVRDSQGREVFYAPNVTAVDLGGGGLDVITASGGQTVVPLTNAVYTPGSNAIDIALNGIIQISGQDYFETGTDRITMASALSAGDQIRAFARSTFGLTQAVLSDWQAEVFNGAGGGSQNFTLLRSPGAVANLDVSVTAAGVGSTLRPLIDYTLSGNTVTITPAPAVGTNNVLIRYGRSLPQDALRGELASTASAADGAGIPVFSHNNAYTYPSVGHKLRKHVSITDHPFGATGGADDTSAIQAALDFGAESVYVPPGEWSHTGLTITAKLRLHGPGTLNETTLLDKSIEVTADGVVIDGLGFTGTETYAAWTGGSSGYRQAFKSFVYFNGCAKGAVKNITTSGKRTAVHLQDCSRVRVTGVDHTGFFPDIGSPGVFATDANWAPSINVQLGGRNIVTQNHATNGGILVLTANETSKNIVSNNTGEEMHDGGCYNSSGNSSIFTGNILRTVRTAGQKIRGSNHVVIGNITIDARENGISLTGNGATPDAFGANGSGTVCAFNPCVDCGPGYGIATGSQDGLLPRDFIIAFNPVINHLGTGGFAAINVAGERGMKVVDNMVLGSTADYGLVAAGTSGNEMVDCDLSRNFFSTMTQGMRLLYVDKSIVNGNIFTDISGGNALEARLCDNNLSCHNYVDDSAALRWSSSGGQECVGNQVLDNIGTFSGDRDVNTVRDNASGTFTGTLTGFTTTITGTFRYVVQGAQVTLFIPALNGTSNATTMTLTGAPSAITPARDNNTMCMVVDNGAPAQGLFRAKTTGTHEFYYGDAGGAFTTAGTKATQASAVTYYLL